MKFKSTVAQATFDGAMIQIEKAVADLQKLLPSCKNLNEHVGLLNAATERRLTGYLLAAETATRIEMQCAGMVAIVKANVGEDK